MGGFDGVASLRARVQTPYSDVTKLAEGMELERRYYRLTAKGKVPLESKDAVAQGEYVYVELRFNARGANHARSAYYVIEDGIPAGFVPIQEDKEFRGAPYSLVLTTEALKRRALDPEKATFFFEEPAWWSDSPRQLGYLMRAQFPGHFRAPPARISDMYALSFRGRTESAELNVHASAEAPPPHP